MKIIVYNKALRPQHKNLISETAVKVGAEVCFIDSEDSIPEDFEDAEVFYGTIDHRTYSGKNRSG